MARSRAELTPAKRVAAATAVQIDGFARRYYELFNQRRLDEAERFIDPQALFTYPVTREHLIGRAGYRELTRRWLEGFPDARITIVSVQVPDDVTAVTEWIGTGTHSGMLELPGFPPIPATGVSAQLPMCETITIAGNSITASSMAFDPRELLRRLGLE